jgi:5-methylcytosine-specific restriction endonuclease McrA
VGRSARSSAATSTVTVVRSDPKPAKRYRATPEEWAGIHRAFVKEMCWVCGRMWSDLHHILPRSQGGDDVIACLAPLCRQCHTRVEARDSEARSKLRGALMPSNLLYLEEKTVDAVAWLNRQYPLVPA